MLSGRRIEYPFGLEGTSRAGRRELEERAPRSHQHEHPDSYLDSEATSSLI